jgi:hypothetical protein
VTLQHQRYQHQRYDAVTPAAYAMSERKRHQHLKFICDVTLLPLRYQRHPHRRCNADMHLGNDSSTAKTISISDVLRAAAAFYSPARQQPSSAFAQLCSSVYIIGSGSLLSVSFGTSSAAAFRSSSAVETFSASSSTLELQHFSAYSFTAAAASTSTFSLHICDGFSFSG